MATLVLTAVGTAIGGPVGGAIGAFLGNAVDRTILFRPKGRDGPRLTDLAVQTSTYGAPIAQLFGTMRVSGSVIWSTDLIEHAASSGGKGGPSGTSYTYSASFAVLLSARPIRDVRRIWADGKLLRGAAGDFKSETGFRLHLGSERQTADPLIASAEGIALAPAHRGCAYAVFENMALADFGNRLPSLTFEVMADEDAVATGAIAEALSEGLIGAGDAATPLIGYAASGETLRAAIAPLIEAEGAWLVDRGDSLALRAGPTGEAIGLDDAGARGGAERGVRRARSLAAVDTAPKSATVTYYDPARDYQAGLQRAERPGPGLKVGRIELPAVIDADRARTLATDMLARLDAGRERRRIALDWRSMNVAPGDRVTITGESGLWRVAASSLEAMVVTLDLVRIARATVAEAAAPGRVLAAVDVPHGATIVFAFEIPPIDDALLAAPRLLVAAAGVSPGWRRAALSVSLDGGARWTPIGPAAAPATLGWIAMPPARAPATLADHVNTLEVVLANDAMTLADADAAALDGGANLVMAGDELLQFGRAERIDATRWRLSDLWRGRRGTERFCGLQAPGDRFVLLDSYTLASCDMPASAMGSEVQVMAAGPGDSDAPPVSSTVVSGASIAPPSPVHLRATERADGGLALSWVRRSRQGWRWSDDLDVPLGEESERYAVRRSGDGERDAGVGVGAQGLILAAPDRPAAGATISVVQMGTHVASAPATITLP